MLLIDVQGRLAESMHNKEKLYQSLQVLIEGMTILGVPILWLEQLPEKLGPTREEIAPLLEGLEPIKKACFSCCRADGFEEKLTATGCRRVLLTGIETHICVYQTGRDLIEKGYEVQVVTDGVSSRTEENRMTGIQRLVQLGASPTSVEMILFELIGTAEDDRFRQIVKLVK